MTRWALTLMAMSGVTLITRAQTLLTVEIDNYVPYHVDVPDPATFASSPGIVPGTARVFQRFVFLGDIVRVNGEQVKGIWTATATNILASPTPQPKQAIADAVRQNIIEMYFDLMQPDGTAIGNIMATGLTRGSPPPGAPLLQTGDTITIVGGTGAFLGVRGQAGMVDAGSPRQASAVEDPANRRTNGGATRSYVLHLIPMSRPEIANTASGPAVFHANFSPVNATQPARSGEILILRATGLGPTLPGLNPGQPFPLDQIQQINSPVTVTVGSKPAEVINKIGWPGLLDTYRLDIRVPDGITAGFAPIQLTAAWMSGPAQSIPVQ
jgi:uncharacterized protein (TIGR03437 family)